MSEKSVQKKKYIVETARGIFMEKGYKEVTMKDIVEACQISRGGLYLYFSSTKELFEEVLRMEKEDTDDVFGQSITKEATPAKILALFFKEQKRELLNKKPSLGKAVYEYFFANQIPNRENLLKKQFDAAVHVLENLITAGVSDEEFYCEDPRGAASNIMYVLEGMKINAQTFGITEKMVDEQLLYIMQGLIIE